MIAPVIILLTFVAPWTHARIDYPYDCTTYDRTNDIFKYNANATSCANSIPDYTCELLFGPGPFPTAGGVEKRPETCYYSGGQDIDHAVIRAAMSLCPKTCGLCCKVNDYMCENKDYPRLNCDTITATQCRDPMWNSIIAEDCPSACGFCANGGCVDTAIDCVINPSLCNKVEFQDMVNRECRKTCGRCTAPTTPSPNFGGCADAVEGCAADPSICNVVELQAFVNSYCKKTCGRCTAPTTPSPNFGGCADAVEGCAADPSICNVVELQAFVNTNCKKTCGRCMAYNTPSPPKSGDFCASYTPDSSTSCKSWAASGFCTNNFYTQAQRKSYCATTCKIC